MCITPVKILNPNYGGDFYAYEEGKVRSASKRLLYTDMFIDVPCGKCVECRRSLYSSYLQRAQMEALTSYVYMITLTYDDAHIPSISFTSDDGDVNIYYSDVKHVQDMFKRLRKCPIFNDRDFRYFSVTEYGTKKFRPHHHLMLFVSKLDTDNDVTPLHLEKELYSLVRSEWRVNVGSRRVPVYEPLFTYHSQVYSGKVYANYDLHLVTNEADDETPAVSSALKYLISYMLKPNEFEQYLISQVSSMSELIPEDISRKIKALLYTRVHMSKHFGFGFSAGRKVMPTVRYMRSNVFNCHFWQLYQSLPETFEQFLNSYIEDDYNAFIDKLFNRNCAQDFQELFQFISPYEMSFLVAIYKYNRSLFATLIHRLHMDIEVFSISLFPLSQYDSTYKDSVAYTHLRRYVDESNRFGIPFIGFRYQDKQSDKYVPMCKYFKRYVCTEQDYLNWLDRVGADTLSELEQIDSSITKVQSLISYNNGTSIELLAKKYDNPYKKLPKNFEVIKSNSIFVPTFSTIVSL